MVRKQRAAGAVDVAVQLADGTYRLSSTWQFDAADSGTTGHPVVWAAAPGARAIISGATQVKGWVPADAASGLWSAPVPGNSNTRQIYIDDKAAPIAQQTPTKLGFKGGWVGSGTGYDISADSVAVAWFEKLTAQQVAEVEFDYPAGNGPWTHSRCRVASYASGKLTMTQPCWTNVTQRAGFSQGSGSLPSMSANTQPASLQNAKALLQPGQWFLDRANSQLYYRLVPGQDMSALTVELPRLERLVQGAGTLANPLHDLTFSGLQFSGATWNNPSTNVGFADVQSNLRVTEANNQGLCNFSSPAGSCPWGALTQPLANISFAASNNITLRGNRFVNLGGAGLSLMYGSSNNLIEGNEFTEIASTGILLGCTYDPTPGAANAAVIKKSCHPNPTLVANDTIDDREIMTGNTVSNNVIHRIGTEYTSACGITLLFARKTTITQNHIFDVPYTAITAGVIQGHVDNSSHPQNSVNINADNTISNNLLHDYLSVRKDGGAIYIEGHQAKYYYKADGITIDPVATLAHGMQVTGNVAFNGNNTNFTYYDDAGAEWINWNGNVAFNAGEAAQGGCNPTGHFWVTNNHVSRKISNYACETPPVDVANVSGNKTIPDVPQPSDIPIAILSQAGLTSNFQALGAATAGKAFAVSAATNTTPYVLVGGNGFSSRPEVFFGGVKSTNVQYVSDGLIFATVPTGSNATDVSIGAFPSTPKITSPSQNGGNGPGYNLMAGTGTPGFTVRVTDDSNLVCATVVAGDGTWKCTEALADGAHILQATQANPAGLVSKPSGLLRVYIALLSQRINDDHASITYTGWSYAKERSAGGVAGDYNDDIHYATADGSKLTMTFEGTSIQVLGETNTDQGNIGISIDGGTAVIASTVPSDGNRHTNVIVYSSPTLTSGKHTITITKLSGKYAVFDGFIVGISPVGRINDNHSAIVYSGWPYITGRAATGIQGDYNDDIHYATTNGNNLTLTFYGTGIQVLGETNTDQGNIGINLDGGSRQTVSTLPGDGKRHTNVAVYTSPVLALGWHTITVTKLSGQYATFDGFSIMP